MIATILIIITLVYSISLFIRAVKIRSEPNINLIVEQKLNEFKLRNFNSEDEKEKAKQQLKSELVETMRNNFWNSASRVKKIWIKANDASIPDIIQKKIDFTLK